MEIFNKIKNKFIKKDCSNEMTWEVFQEILCKYGKHKTNGRFHFWELKDFSIKYERFGNPMYYHKELYGSYIIDFGMFCNILENNKIDINKELGIYKTNLIKALYD